jgi:hypothetical protein
MHLRWRRSSLPRHRRCRERCAAAPGDDLMFSPDDNMLAFGSCLAGFGILVTALLALLFRNPNAPRWTRPELVAMLVCVPLTVMIGLGLGYTGYGLLRLAAGTGDPRQLLVLVTVLILLFLVWRGLGIRRRLKDSAAATDGVAASAYLATKPSLAVGERPPPSPAPRARSGGGAA